MSGLVNSLFGSGKSTFNTNVTTPAPSAEERELIRISTELSKRQLENIEQLQPFQKELIELSLADMRRQGAASSALDSAVTPEDQAAFAKEEFDRARKLGPVQDQILEQQLANMRGELTPGQQTAVNAQIEAGYGDIDRATGEGIGLIADEIANSRGLRLTDTPILREATLLSERGLAEKSSLAKNVRASALTQMPQIASGIGLGQQNLASQTQAFQAELRNRAAMNRMALTGNTMSSGIGLASAGGGAGPAALSALAGNRSGTTNSAGRGFNPGQYLSGWGNFMQGAGSLMGGGAAASDRRLKEDIVKIGALPSGIPVYRFRYLGTEDEQVGVMADEVLKVIPEAVSKDADGYYVVDYRMVR